jgi:UDP-N-acetylmuramoyl-tripeptide--D-alanyl-D-alanine ligase
MPFLAWGIFFVLLASFGAFLFRRLLRYLHIYQQEEYDGLRFFKWLIRTRSFDFWISCLLILAGLAIYKLGLPRFLLALFLVPLFIAAAMFEPDPRKAAKKKLVMTNRAKRIFGIAFLLGLCAAYFILRKGSFLFWVLLVQFLPACLVLANLLLKPYENAVQLRFKNEASAKLARIAPKIVGITGSFGKTSVKHILGHVLELNGPTLFTPGSVNTLMGIARVIRERMTSDCRTFIVEMGAYGKGSIRKLCAFTPPQYGVITALGAAHYERFKSLNAVAEAKFELAEAVLANGTGRIIIHESVLAQDYARRFVAAHRDRFIVCGAGAEADARMLEAKQTEAGIELSLLWKDKTYDLFAPLFGLHHAGNIALAFVSAATFGVAPGRVIAALRTTPQIAHRLEVKPQADDTLIIDDAYNANPIGFEAAVELLSALAVKKGGRRILITPGLAELGAKHDEEHARLGALAAAHTDIALAVKPDRIPTFCEAYKNAKGEDGLVLVENLAAAQDWLRLHARPKDIVLYENDLPDLYEQKLRM